MCADESFGLCKKSLRVGLCAFGTCSRSRNCYPINAPRCECEHAAQPRTTLSANSCRVRSLHLPWRSVFRVDLKPRVYLPLFITSARRELMLSMAFFVFLIATMVDCKNAELGPRLVGGRSRARRGTSRKHETEASASPYFRKRLFFRLPD